MGWASGNGRVDGPPPHLSRRYYHRHHSGSVNARSPMQTPVLAIRLFGALDLRYGDRLLSPLASARAETLLAYLVLHRDTPQSRQHLAFVLWPDSSEAQARTNLRHVLHDLRRALPDADRFLDVSARTLRWRTDAPYWLDVAVFEDALARAQDDTADGGLAALREAVAIYAGDLLDGCYDDWLLAPARAAAPAISRGARAPGDAARGARRPCCRQVGYAERLIQNDPLNEQAYRLLMRLHAASGQLARALQTYHLCSATLERELGVEPSPATRAAYEALLPAERGHAAPVECATGGSNRRLIARRPSIRMDASDDALARNQARPSPGRSPQRRARGREDAARRGASVVVCPDRSRDRRSPLLRERRRNGLRAVGRPGCVPPRSPRASAGSIALISPHWPHCCRTSSRLPPLPSCRRPDPMPSSGGGCSKPPLRPSTRREDRCCSSPMTSNGATRRPFSSSTTSCGSSLIFRSSWRPRRDERRSILSTP